jgi:hypothetical protein
MSSNGLDVTVLSTGLSNLASFPLFDVKKRKILECVFFSNFRVLQNKLPRRIYGHNPKMGNGTEICETA